MGSWFWVWSHLWPITAMAPQTRPLLIYGTFWITAPLLELIIMKRSFYCVSLAKWWILPRVTPLGKQRHHFERWTLFFFSFPCSLWRRLLLCVVADPPALGGLRAPLAALSPISNRGAAVLQTQQLFQKQKMKRVLKSFSEFRPLKCLRSLCNAA